MVKNNKKTTKSPKVVEMHLARENPIPRILTYPQGMQVFRYQFSAAVTKYPVTRHNMLAQLLVYPSTGTLGTRILQAVLLKKVEMWSPPAAAGSGAAGANIVFGGTQSGNRVVDDTNVSLDPAYLSIKPPKDSTDFFWCEVNVNESEALFTVTAPAGTIMDLHCICTTASNFSTTNGTETTTATGTVSVTYFNSLDQTTNVIKPLLSLNTIN